jgi:hypothetical protein
MPVRGQKNEFAKSKRWVTGYGHPNHDFWKNQSLLKEVTTTLVPAL